MYPDHTSKFPELGFYGLPGHSRTPRDVLRQVQDAEALGIGNVMLSERADYKEISAICGACAAVTESICIGTSATNLNMRHPVVTASMATTLNRLSNGRFALGLAKGVGLRWKMLSVPFPTYEREREFIEVMRRLWRGETVDGHAGELGNFPRLGLADYVDERVVVRHRQDSARRMAAWRDRRCLELCGAVAEGIRSRRRRADYPCQHAGGIRARAARV